MATVAKNFTLLESLDEKRRKKSEEAKSLLLPQKKRVLPPSNVSSPIKKSPKLSAEEGAPEETLIRETEAALKNLSGSWPGPKGGYTTQQEDAPAFENLFDEKKSNLKMSPSSTSSSSSDNTCSLKDVITLREQHEHEESSDDKTSTSKNKSNIRIGDSKQGKTTPKSQYQSPDFNELVDDSSNELEIDMSEAASETNESNTKCDSHDKKKIESKLPSKYPNESSMFPSFRTSTTASPFSTTSAFRPPQSKNPPPLGPFPAEATFVGYPTESSPPEDKPKNIVPLKPTETPVEAQVKSPEAANKQYTILQPAGVGSRAASTLQEVAREGVLSVSAVNSAPSSETNTKMVVPAPALSPNSIGRGKF